MVPLVDEAVQRVSSYASLDDWIEKNARSEREGIGVEHAELWYNPADEEEAACFGQSRRPMTGDRPSADTRPNSLRELQLAGEPHRRPR